MTAVRAPPLGIDDHTRPLQQPSRRAMAGGGRTSTLPRPSVAERELAGLYVVDVIGGSAVVTRVPDGRSVPPPRVHVQARVLLRIDPLGLHVARNAFAELHRAVNGVLAGSGNGYLRLHDLRKHGTSKDAQREPLR